MNVLYTEPLVAGCYEVKSLIALYRKYAESSPRSDAGIKSADREMHIVKEQILKHLLEMKRFAKRLEADVKPSF